MTTLLLIDVQKDFHPGGSLAIPTADQDAERTAQWIRRNSAQIDRIVATLDSHSKLHIAHPGFWVSGQNSDDSAVAKSVVVGAVLAPKATSQCCHCHQYQRL